MNPCGGPIPVSLGATRLALCAERALWWPEARLLVVSDLHLGKAERMARRGGPLVPPYETEDTLARLEALVAGRDPAHVVCLGDSFDDTAAARALPGRVVARLGTLMAGRRWTWVLGNHDPGPVDLGGTQVAELRLGGIALRHVAEPGETGPEVSGHYHPKAGIGGARRPCFVTDGRRLILPAFGTYTGGLAAGDPAVAGLMGPEACAILAGPTMAALPLAACGRRAAGPPRGWPPRQRRGAV